MKIIYSGGVNGSIRKDELDYYTYGFGNYFMLQIRDELEELITQSGVIAVCVAAKPNKVRYERRFIDMGFELDSFVFLGRENKAEWGRYDAIIILGGETKELKKWLDKNGFNVGSLTRCRLIAGDSAGAYVLASYTLIDYKADGSRFEIVKGFIPELNILVAAHTNNNHYHQRGLGAALKKWCTENKAEYIGLKENEIKVTELTILN